MVRVPCFERAEQETLVRMAQLAQLLALAAEGVTVAWAGCRSRAPCATWLAVGMMGAVL